MFDDGDKDTGHIGNYHMSANWTEEELMMEEELDIHDIGKDGNYNLVHGGVQEEAMSMLEQSDTDNSDAPKAEGRMGFDNEDTVDRRRDWKPGEDKQAVQRDWKAGIDLEEEGIDLKV
ncbi:DNA repair/recombination protein [Perilla frutescens var. hirtella]|nr:DNA repair/recombination protein [Perilla frutescens var. hirtella]KAH6817850.1 DNA repair/recombination protein [Perilla frutescens var. frutescens]